MKWYIHNVHRLDPFVMMIIGVVMLLIGLMVLAYTVGSTESNFEKACLQKGGVPLIARSETKICLKSDFVIRVD